MECDRCKGDSECTKTYRGNLDYYELCSACGLEEMRMIDQFVASYPSPLVAREPREVPMKGTAHGKGGGRVGGSS